MTLPVLMHNNRKCIIHWENGWRGDYTAYAPYGTFTVEPQGTWHLRFNGATVSEHASAEEAMRSIPHCTVVESFS